MHDLVSLSPPPDPEPPRFKSLRPRQTQDDKAESCGPSPLRTVAPSNAQYPQCHEVATVTTFVRLHSHSSENLLSKQMRNRPSCSQSRASLQESSIPGEFALKGHVGLNTQTRSSPMSLMRAQQSTPNLRKTRSFWHSLTDLAGW